MPERILFLSGAVPNYFLIPILGNQKGAKIIRSIAPKTIVAPSNPISINDDNKVKIKRTYKRPKMKPEREIGSIVGYQ